jgi:hypothetical protein
LYRVVIQVGDVLYEQHGRNNLWRRSKDLFSVRTPSPHPQLVYSEEYEAFCVRQAEEEEKRNLAARERKAAAEAFLAEAVRAPQSAHLKMLLSQPKRGRGWRMSAHKALERALAEQGIFYHGVVHDFMRAEESLAMNT